MNSNIKVQTIWLLEIQWSKQSHTILKRMSIYDYKSPDEVIYILSHIWVINTHREYNDQFQLSKSYFLIFCYLSSSLFPKFSYLLFFCLCLFTSVSIWSPYYGAHIMDRKTEPYHSKLQRQFFFTKKRREICVYGNRKRANKSENNLDLYDWKVWFHKFHFAFKC